VPRIGCATEELDRFLGMSSNPERESDEVSTFELVIAPTHPRFECTQ
jgi:hypothetical protein